MYTVKAAPKKLMSKNPEKVFNTDLTQYVLETNDFSVAKSCVDGSQRPTGVFKDGALVASNLPKLNAVLMRRARRAAIATYVAGRGLRSFTPPKAPAKPGKVRWQRKKAMPA